MSKRLTSEQKKKRLRQLREAQQRRRAKLREDSCHFVQIILSSELLQSVRELSVETGETVQQLIGRIVAEKVQCTPPNNAAPSLEEQAVPTISPVDEVSLENYSHHPEPEPVEEMPVLVEAIANEPEPLPPEVAQPVEPIAHSRPPMKLKAPVSAMLAGQLDLFA